LFHAYNIYTAQRYINAVYVVVLCLWLVCSSVHLSQASIRSWTQSLR